MKSLPAKIIIIIFALIVHVTTVRGDNCPRNSNLQWNDRLWKYHCVCDDPNYVPRVDDDCFVARAYGETCSGFHQVCSLNITNLYCIDGKCQCGAEDRWNSEKSLCMGSTFCERQQGGYFYYDPTVQTCFARIGALLDVGASKNALNFSCPPNSAPVTTSYTSTGQLDNETRCQCNAGWTAKHRHFSEGCIPLKLFGETCSTELGDPCDKKAFQSCLEEEKVCGCNVSPYIMVWDPVLLKCRIKNGEQCDGNRFEGDYGFCVHGASCLPKTGEPKKLFCQCKENFESNNSNGFCYKNNGKTCENNFECLPSNVCMDNVCTCPDPVLQFHDAEAGKCRSFAGARCSGDGMTLCTHNAECKNGTCECEQGFVNPGNGVCQQIKGYLESCLGGQCNASQGLVCSSGNCTCISSSLEFVEGRGCTAGLGARCGLLTPLGNCNGDSNSNRRCGYFVQCEDSAYCKSGMEDETCKMAGFVCPDRCALRFS